MKKLLEILVISLFFCNTVFAEQVYYCADIDANGFSEGKKRKPKLIIQEKFTLYYDLELKIKPEDKIRLKFSHEDFIRIYRSCDRPHLKQMPEITVCSHGGTTIMFNEKTLNYGRAFFSAYAMGHKEDTMMLAYGNCEKF